MLMGIFLFAHQLMAQDISVSGNVKDEKGEALIGVSIQVKRVLRVPESLLLM